MSTQTRFHAEPADAPAEPAAASFVLALRRRWLLVLVAAVAAATAAYVVSAFALPTVYRSTATVIVHNKPATVPAGTLPVDPFIDDQSLGETFRQLAVQPAVVEQVASDLGMSAKTVTQRVHVHSLARTPLVVITFDGATAQQAARGAQAYAAQFVQSTSGATDLPGTALVVSGATRPTDPVAPRTLLNTLVAGLAGLLLGLVALFRSAASRAPVPSAEPAAGVPSTVVEWHPVAAPAAARQHGSA